MIRGCASNDKLIRHVRRFTGVTLINRANYPQITQISQIQNQLNGKALPFRRVVH
jgi:hypothetical protein